MSVTYEVIPTAQVDARLAACLPVVEARLGGVDLDNNAGTLIAPLVVLDPDQRPDVADLWRVMGLEQQETRVHGEWTLHWNGDAFTAICTITVHDPAWCEFSFALRADRHLDTLLALAIAGKVVVGDRAGPRFLHSFDPEPLRFGLGVYALRTAYRAGAQSRTPRGRARGGRGTGGKRS